jgi:2-(1,2-epoxy-1,2-dihydrophenyl)acetyl-CoA isomerase
MSYENLRFEAHDGVANVTIDRPKAANAIDLQTARELYAVANRCDEDPDVRAVLLTGTGRMFCAGGDLGSFAAAGDAVPALLKEITTYLHAAVSRMARMDAPVIAAVNGAAAGAGLSLACAADLVLAAESASFTLAYTRVGLTPDGSSTYFLPRLVGARRAAELVLTNRVLSAGEALEWGIASRVVPDAELLSEAGALARKLAAGPTAAFGASKRLLVESSTNGLEAQMELETRAIADAARGEEGREGIAAFLAKRAPTFRERG